MKDRAPERVGVGLRGASMAVRTGRAVLLRRPADVAMVEATDFRNLDDRPQLRPPRLAAHPAYLSGARDEFVTGGSTRSSRSGLDADGVHSERGHRPDTPAESSR